MNRIAAKQQGATGSGFVAIIVLIVLSVLVLLKLFPVYMEHFNVTTSLNSLADESNIKEMKSSEIKAMLTRRFSINDVTSVNRDNITVKKGKSDMTIDIIYEVRKPMVGNIDIVIYFSDQITI